MHSFPSPCQTHTAPQARKAPVQDGCRETRPPPHWEVPTFYTSPPNPAAEKKSFSDYNLIEHRYGLSISEGAGTTQLCRGASLNLVLTSSVYSWAQKDSGEGSKTPDLLREHIRRGCIVGQKILFFPLSFLFLSYT